MPKIRNNFEEKSIIKVEGYIDNKKRVFVVTNHDECVSNGILGFVEQVKCEEETKVQNQHIKELLIKYRPVFYE